MKIATFNINNVNRRFDSLLDWLAAEEPDIACGRDHDDRGCFGGAVAKLNAGCLVLWLRRVKTTVWGCPMAA